MTSPRRLFRDGYVVAAMAALLAGAALYVLPAFPAQWSRWIGENAIEGVMVGLLFMALASGARRLPRDERHFWTWIAIAYAAYVLTFPRYHGMAPAAWHGAIDAAEEFLNLFYYAAILIAVVTRSHHRAGDLGTPLARIELGGTLLFLMTLLAYFVILPGTATRPAVPSLVAYVILDAVLVAAFLTEFKASTSPRWRVTLLLLTASSGIWLVLNTLELLMHWERIGVPMYGSPFDLAWMLQYVPLIAAVRLRRWPETVREREPEALELDAAFTNPVRGAVLMVYVAVLPAIHLGTHATGFLDATNRPARDVITIVALVLLGVLAYEHQRTVGRLHRALSERLRRSQKLEAVGRLAGGIAHDFNNLMTVICGHAGLLLDATPPSDPRREGLEAIRSAGDRAAVLTHRLLSLSRGGSPLHATTLDPNDLVRETAQLVRRALGEHITVHVELDPTAPPVRADRGQIEQVLMNLVMNARDAMPDGGTLCFATRSSHRDPDRPAGAAAGGVVLEVADDGVGMDEDVRAHAFDVFFTTKPDGEGHGLGLAMAHGIVRRHGGQIDLESARGHGTTARVWLPPALGRPEPRQIPSVQGLRRGGERVLVVEDQAPVREVAERMLTTAGYRVVTAGDSSEARRLIACMDDLDAVISDIVMPGGSGLELRAWVRSERPALPVLLMTGYAERIPGADGEESVLRKPFDASDLTAALRSVLDRREDPLLT